MTLISKNYIYIKTPTMVQYYILRKINKKQVMIFDNSICVGILPQQMSVNVDNIISGFTQQFTGQNGTIGNTFSITIQKDHVNIYAQKDGTLGISLNFLCLLYQFQDLKIVLLDSSNRPIIDQYVQKQNPCNLYKVTTKLNGNQNYKLYLYSESQTPQWYSNCGITLTSELY